MDVVVLWFLNENGKLLLALRSVNKKQDPGVWGPSVTGKVEVGETVVQALIRETKEELSLPASSYQPLFLLKKEFAHPDGQPRFFHIYLARLHRDVLAALQPDPNEVAAIKWFSLKQISTMLSQTPDQLVPSAPAVWPATFAALDKLSV